MPRPIVKVGVNGYGVIGKRVADAISKQSDMKLIGVSDISTDYRVKMAEKKGLPIFCSMPEKLEEMSRGLKVQGTLQDLLKDLDVIIDCTPAGLGAKNKVQYDKAGVKSIFQGGEKHELAGSSFVAQCNYENNIGKNSTRVVSCNTTGICRIAGSIHKEIGIKKVRVVLFRRGTDPWESHKTGLINTVVPEPHVPSHQGPDARTVIPDLNIVSMASKGPFNLGHMHYAMIEPRKNVDKEQVSKVLRSQPRLVPVMAKLGVDSMNAVNEMVRDLGRPRGDMWEVVYWDDILSVQDGEIYIVYQVHNESIVVPENVDAVRALTGLENDWRRSVEKTDKSLGITSQFL